ncbi:hypothetical protein QZH41_013158 [Actinostola sp. cb2023]|nr:hypothetical protein QZH41_013158 [Actinostola sp. cb2023]
MADEISLSDHYVVLLESVVNQTTLLREEIQKDKENDKGVLENITNTLDGLSNSVRSLTVANRGRRVRQCRGGATTRVPKLCSNDVRSRLKRMAKSDPENSSLRLEESQDSEQNLSLFHRVRDDIYHAYGGEAKCPWTVLQMRTALKTYMRSLVASAKRKASGHNAAHNQTCRRQKQKKRDEFVPLRKLLKTVPLNLSPISLNEKLGRRAKSLETKLSWSTEKKTKFSQCLTIDYVSSEESEAEEEPPYKTIAYVVKPLNWESQELKKAKKSLDKHHKSSLPDLVKRRVTPRRNGYPSQRRKPDNCPDWACL